ncbi:MAG TPA: peptidase domain-containing ABC transporter [Bacteroidales bacterium]|nr:peptidase domain-containing ABC transporter [Bacteroidales bacterium]
MVSDFLIKIMKLPLGFFDSKNIGDLMQRIQDHQRLQSFLTISSLNVLFSTMTFLLFSGVLWYYNFKIFLIFFAGSLLYALWVFIFIKRRREIDYQRFSRTAENQNTLIQLITGMQEIKLYNCEERKRNEWEKIQEQLYELSLKSLTLFQNQSAGALFFMRTKDIVISFFVAVMVIKGSLTLGMMLSIQFILGQLSNPVEQLVNFIREAQDASISMERLEEINALKDEEVSDKTGRKSLPVNREIRVKKVSFQYEGPHSVYVLKDVDITIPENRITAIVGSSGSGKTTLIKLLLGFYKPVSGEILIGEHLLESFSGSFWRSQCGSVMQDGYIFSDTIENNISMSDPVADREKLQDAIRCANLNSFIHDLPSGVKTRIGQEGAGISEGQKQRLLIARAVYRNPSYLFFDEATNSLDSLNEQIIVENLNSVFRGKTVVVVAHRLSTVRHADQIIVLDQGSVVEQGTHEELILKKSFYYRLVYNQLELG